ncbi:MAG: hypothetical protein COA78_20290 [Blastopirellula sp.]|nr:MAG: hypothetical protein COA78_20290 [Blastopirellula sp.]
MANDTIIKPRKTKYQDKISIQEKEIEDMMKASKGEVVEEEVIEEESKEETTFKKRYGDLRRHSGEVEKELRKEIEGLKNSAVEVELPASDEDIEAWREKYPDVAAIVETIATKMANEKFAKAEIDISEVKKGLSTTAKLRATDEIRETHKDFDKLQDSDEFHDWVDEQPKWIQDALFENSDDAKSVIRVIDLYKTDKGMTVKAKKKKEKEAASVVKTTSTSSTPTEDVKGKIKESDVAKMSIKEFEDNEEEITKSMSSGNFIYDVTGGAR